MDGTLLWKKDLGVLDAGAFDVPEFQWSNASSPLLHGSIAIVQCDVQKMESYIVAFDADSGNEVWRTARKTYPSWATPNVIETNAGAELIVNGTEDILGYEPATGKELWRIHGTSMISVPTPFLADGLIYAASGYSRFQQPIYAVKPGSRGDLTKTAAIVWTNQRAPYLTTPIVYRGYLHSIKTNCTMFVMDAKTGKEAYQQRIGTGACTASPVAADGRVFIPTEDGEIYVIKAGPVYEVLGINKIGETLMATPALTDRMMIVRGEHHVFGIQ